MLLVYGAWWDDMLIWNVPSNMLEKFLGPSSFNNPFLYSIYQTVSTIENLSLRTYIYRLVPFICWFISTSSFFVIIKKVTNNRLFSLYSSLLVASCGINKCIILICCFHYSISIALFMLGLVFFVYDYFENVLTYKILSAFLWLLSLLVWRSAVLVIPFILLVACYYKSNINFKSKKGVVIFVGHFLKNYWIYVCALLIFSSLYTTILAPKGPYKAYYHIDFLHIIISPIITATSCLSIFYQYLSSVYNAFSLGNIFILSLVLFPLVTFVLLCQKEENNQNYELLYLCLFLFFFSILPQKMIGDTYSLLCYMDNQNSRQASLAIFPLAVILCFFFQEFRSRIRAIVAGVFVSGAILYSNYVILDFERGWARNESIILFLKSHPELGGKKITVYDNVREFSAFKSVEVSNYEYEGCARLAYGNNTKTHFNSYYVDDPNNYKFNPDYSLIMLRNKNNPGFFRLMRNRLFNYRQYQEDVKNFIHFSLYKKEYQI